MLDGSDYFYGKLLESQKNFAQSMNYKTDGKFYKVLIGWLAKQNQPRYYDIAIHKVIHAECGLEIAKSTVSTWLDRIPQLLEQVDVLKELLNEDKKTPSTKKDEVKYTKAEWEQLYRLEGYKLNTEYRTMMEKLKNPNIPDVELMKLTGASQRLINKINNYGITMSNEDSQKEFIKLNEEIMKLGNERLLREIEKMPAFNMRDLKALSGIVDDVFKQNRLLTGQSTENVAHGIDDVYEAILKKAEGVKNLNSGDSDQNSEEKIETAKIIRD